MHPELFGSIRAYPVFLILGDVVGIIVAVYCGRRAGVGRTRLTLALVVVTIGAFLGAKFYGLIERGGALGSFKSEFFSGYRFPGGVIGCVSALWLVSRSPLSKVTAGVLADAIAPSFGFAMAVVRIGCFMAGCCAGRVCDVPWAVEFPAGTQAFHAHVRAGLVSREAAFSLPVHPLQLYFASMSLALGFLTLWLQPRKSYDGQVFLIYVALHATGQFVLEFLRFGSLPHVQYASLALGICATGALFFNSLRCLARDIPFAK